MILFWGAKEFFFIFVVFFFGKKTFWCENGYRLQPFALEIELDSVLSLSRV